MTEPAAPDDTEVIEQFRELARTGSRPIRNALIERHMGLAAHIARRYARSGSEDDVRQIAMLGLVKAVDRFDPDHGAAFSSFAGRTIEGEVKRFFRDTSWTVRVPRSAKELHLLVRRASDELGQRLGRGPTVDELATHLDTERDDVVRGLAATAAFHVGSLDAPTSGSDDGPDGDRQVWLASEDAGFDASVDRHLVERLLETLGERERTIVRLRFYDELSQTEIAERVGVSQMHVSRLLRQSFEQMRTAMTEPS